MKTKSISLKELFSAKAVAAGTILIGVSGLASAAEAGADVSTTITGALTTVGSIGGAVLAVYASIKVFKLVRSAL